MTLSERLKQYQAETGLSAHKLGKFLGTNDMTISKLLRYDQYTPKIAEKIYKVLGEDYKQYIVYSTCSVCGSKYIPRNKKSVICSEKECVMEYNRRVAREKYGRGHEPSRRNDATRKKLIIKDRPKPKQTIAEFMAGKQYGERQRGQLIALQKEQRMCAR